MKRRIWSDLLKILLMENFILCAVLLSIYLFGHVTFHMDLGIWARPHHAAMPHLLFLLLYLTLMLLTLRVFSSYLVAAFLVSSSLFHSYKFSLLLTLTSSFYFCCCKPLHVHCLWTGFCQNSWPFFALYVDITNYVHIGKAFHMACWYRPGNTRELNETLCSRVEVLVIVLVITLPISWEVSVQ